jgi:hypothetical protein
MKRAIFVPPVRDAEREESHAADTRAAIAGFLDRVFARGAGAGDETLKEADSFCSVDFAEVGAALKRVSRGDARPAGNALSNGVRGAGFSEVQLRVAERSSVRRVMSSSCSQRSPVKE